MDSAKDHAIEAIQQLPDDVSYEDIMERLLFIQKVELGLRDVQEGRIKSHEEVRERMSKWLK
jgi:predicted transcriptional regulator